MLKIKDVMDENVVTVRPDIDVRTVCRILIKNKLSGVPVVDKNEKLIGFISERDIIAKACEKGFVGKKVQDIMNSKVQAVKDNMLIEDAAKIFSDKSFRYLPVVKERKVIGIVSRKDVIERLLGHYY